jgi:hypothetical protein
MDLSQTSKRPWPNIKTTLAKQTILNKNPKLPEGRKWMRRAREFFKSGLDANEQKNMAEWSTCNVQALGFIFFEEWKMKWFKIRVCN